jgi:ketosteroid isomerase-like protein
LNVIAISSNTTVRSFAYVLFVGGIMEPSRAANATAVRSALHRTLRQHAEAMMRGEASAAAAIFAVDVRWTPADVPALVGRDAVEAYISSFLSQSGPPKRVQHNSEELYIFGDVAIDIGTIAISIRTGGETLEVGQRYMLMWRRQSGDTWEIFRDMTNTAPPLAPTAY